MYEQAAITQGAAAQPVYTHHRPARPYMRLRTDTFCNNLL